MPILTPTRKHSTRRTAPQVEIETLKCRIARTLGKWPGHEPDVGVRIDANTYITFIPTLMRRNRGGKSYSVFGRVVDEPSTILQVFLPYEDGDLESLKVIVHRKCRGVVSIQL